MSAGEGGVLNQSKSSIILKKSTIFALSLKQTSSSSFHMFIYARSERVPLTLLQICRIYPGILKFILDKISLDPGRLHDKHAKESQTLFTFLTTENFSGLPCAISSVNKCKYGAYSDLSSYAVNLPR